MPKEQPDMNKKTKTNSYIKNLICKNPLRD